MNSNDKIENLGTICFKQLSNISGISASAIIYIPQGILNAATNKGLTLYLNTFFIAKDILHFRKPSEHKIAVFAFPNATRIGNKDYSAPYVKTELVLQETDLAKVIELIQRKTLRKKNLGDFL